MTPNTYFKILLLVLGQDSFVRAFTIADFLANEGKQVLVNASAQYGAYIGSQAIGNQVTPEIVLPVIANLPLAGKFLQIPGKSSVEEWIATLALTYGAGAAVTKVGDVPMNFAAGAMISALSQYMESWVNIGNIPFAYMRSKRINYSTKYHIQMHFLFLGLLLASAGCCVIIYYVSKWYIKASRSEERRVGKECCW